MTEIVISPANWHMALAAAIKEAGPDDVIVVDTEAKLELGQRAAGRLGRSVRIIIRPPDLSIWDWSPREASSRPDRYV
ncbi:MAG TPA: hypothetical protein VFK47_07360 [Ktedonobacteraceae bacterium]|nr:hypothetical protein [Ktedonobacteraceae bacterium]